jgi:hypothetical protein
MVNKVNKLIDDNKSTGLYLYKDLDTKKISKLVLDTTGDTATLKIKLASEQVDYNNESIYYLNFENTGASFSAWRKWLSSVDVKVADAEEVIEEALKDGKTANIVSTYKISNLYKIASVDYTRLPSKMVDMNNNFFRAIGI